MDNSIGNKQTNSPIICVKSVGNIASLISVVLHSCFCRNICNRLNSEIYRPVHGYSKHTG